jgi:hypothetical protein
VWFYSLFNLGARSGAEGNATPRTLYLRERDPVSIAQEAGWAPGQLRTGAENLAPHRDSIPGPYEPYLIAIPAELFRSTKQSVPDGKETNSKLYACVQKVIETEFDSETAISGRTQLVLSTPQCHDSEQFPGDAQCGGQQPSALFT